MNPTQPTKTYAARLSKGREFKSEDERRAYYMQLFDENWRRRVFNLPHNANHPFTGKPGNGNQIRKVTL